MRYGPIKKKKDEREAQKASQNQLKEKNAENKNVLIVEEPEEDRNVLGETYAQYKQRKAEEERRNQQLELEKDEVYQQFLKYRQDNNAKGSVLDQIANTRDEQDFEEKSQYVAGKDREYEYINDAESGYKEKYGLRKRNITSEYAKQGLDYITDDERANYNYVYATQGKEKAREYLDSLELTKRMTESEVEESKAYAEEHPILASAGTVVDNTMNAGRGFFNMVGQTVTGKEIDPYDYANLSTHKSNAVRETVSDNINNGVGSFLYQTGMSIADFVGASVASAPLAAIGINPGMAQGLILASNAATQGVLDAKERGIDDEKAILTGTLQGAAEMVFEKLSIDQLKMFSQTSPDTIKSLVKNVLKGMAVEGSEEGATTIANTLTDWLVNKDMSAFSQSKDTYMQNGLSEEEAEKQAKLDWVKQLGLDVLGGAISGGVMSAGASGIGYAFNRNQNLEIENAEAETENTETETQIPETESEELTPETVEPETIEPEVQQETIADEVPWEEAPMYDGEMQNAEVAPAQPEESAAKMQQNEEIPEENAAEDKKVQSARSVVETTLQYGKADDAVAADIVKNDTIKKVFEDTTGVKISGTEEQQKNAVKEVVRVYAESHGSTIQSQNTPVATSASQNATVNGKGVKIIGVKSVNGLNPKFEASDGKVYTTEEVAFAENANRKLYADASKLAIVAGEETANSFIKNYRPEFGMAAYSWGFDALYKAGRNGVPLESALKAADYAVQNTDPHVMAKAWELGTKAKEAEDSKVKVETKQQKRKGKGTFEDETRQGGAVAEVARLVADRTGIDIVRKAGLDNDANAAFVPSTMTMLLSENAQNEFAALIHELGEFGLSYDREGMKQVQEAIVRWWAENNGVKGMEDLDSIIKSYQRSYAAVKGTETKTQAIDEIVNDALGGLFSSETGVDEFVQWLQKDSGYNQTEQRTIIQRVIDIIDNVVEYLKQVVKDSTLSRAAREAAKMEEQRAHEIRQQFLDVLDTAIETANTTGEYQTEKNVVQKFSLNVEQHLEPYNEHQKENWKTSKKIVLYENENQLIDFVEKANARQNAGQKLYFGIIKNDIAERVKSELGHDIKGYNCALYSDNVRKIFKDHGDAKKEELRGQRAIIINDFARIPEIISNPEKIEDGGVYNRNPVIHFKKDGITIVGIITNGALDLYPQTMYASIKNRSLATATDEQAPVYTSETTRSTASNNIVSDTSENASDEIKFSLAGVDALTADNDARMKAEKLLQEGKSELEVARETGWYRGYDGKWRFEIDDSQIEILDIKSNYMKLDQLLKHDKLFEAYPILREVDVVFQNLRENQRGNFNSQFFTVNLNRELLDNKEQLKETLIHEIQHVIQSEEGFANGANEEYWNARLERGFDSRPKDIQRQEWKLRSQYLEMKEESPEFVADMENLEKMRPNVPRGEVDWDTLEQIEEDPIEWQLYDTERERLEEKYGDRVWDFFDLQHKMDQIKSEGVRDGQDLYYATAGEIEAREVTDRLFYNEADRKKYPPRSRRENLIKHDVVFANTRYSSDEGKRYSLPTDIDNESTNNLISSSESYQELTDNITKQLKNQKPVEITETSIRKATEKMSKKYKSVADTDFLIKDIGALFRNMASAGTQNTGNFIYLAENIVRPMIEQSKNNLKINDSSKQILNDIKSKRIKLDKIQMDEAAHYAGSYNDFRRKLFGRAFLSKEGTSLDTLWKQWAAEYPEWFQEDLSPADQPVRLAEIIDTLKEDYVSEYGLTLDETVTYAAAELMMEYFELPEVKAQFQGTIKGDSLQAYMDGLKKEYHDKYVDYTRYFTDVFKKYPEQNRKQLARQQAKFNQRTAEERTKRLERQAKKKFKDRIIKNTKDVVRLLEDNTDKKHVPEVLKNTTITFLKSMDFLSESGWNTQDTMQLQNRLNAVYRKFSSEENAEDGSTFMQEIDPDFLPTLNKMIEELEVSTEIKKIADMSSEQLKDIDYLVHTLKRAISTANKLIANERYEMISELGDSSMNHMKTLKAKKMYGKYGTMADDMLQKHMLSPKTYFKQMGDGALSIYNELREGLDKRTWKLKAAEDYMKGIIGDTKISKWTGKKANTHKFEYNGKKFDLTDGQLMNLYVLSKRPQALGHLTAGMSSDNGGFIIDTKSTIKGQTIPERKINISEEQLKEMFEKLTPEQKKMADQMQRFLARDCADWGNEVSMIMYGYKKFREKTYWPIKTDDNYNKTDDKNADKSSGSDNSSLYGIRNLGMTKNLVKNAKNPIVVGDIFDVFSEHVANMANYNAFVVPLTDAMKWFNYRSRTEEGGVNGSVKEEMQRAFGKGAKSYFVNFIKDVNGETGKGVASEIANTFTSKYKAAAVGANIRTVVQQPTSILRVMSVMDPKYLAAGVAHGSAIKEMKENSAIAIWKSWGYFETGLGQSMKQVLTGEGTATEKLVELGMQGAGKADDLAWGVIWNAVKEEIKDKHKNIDTSSEEYKKLVSDRFNEVIDETQVVDTVLHRSQIMRSKNGLVKLATAFMAEPTKSYNLLYEATLDTYQNNSKENRVKVARRATVYALTAIATAAAASLVDAFRDDDEEKEWTEKYLENFKANSWDNINPMNMIPYLKEIPSFFKGYDASRMDLEGISNLVSAVQQIEKYMEGDSSKTLYGVAKNVIRALSQVTGIPVYNLLRDSEALVEQFMFAPFDENKPTNKTIRIRLLKAMKEGNDRQLKKYLTWYDEQYQEKVAEGKSDKEAKSALKTSITGQFKEIYQNSTTAEKIKIKNLLLKISVNGQQLYKDYDWSTWDEKK